MSDPQFDPVAIEGGDDILVRVDVDCTMILWAENLFSDFPDDIPPEHLESIIQAIFHGLLSGLARDEDDYYEILKELIESNHGIEYDEETIKTIDRYLILSHRLSLSDDLLESVGVQLQNAGNIEW